MSRGHTEQAQPAPQPVAPPTPSAPVPGVLTKRDRIVQALAARGIAADFSAPMPTEIRDAGLQIGRLVGRDRDPNLEYVRVSANNAASIGRYMDRGYRMVDPDADVRLEGCEGSSDLMMAVPREYAAKRRQKLRQARKGGAETQAQGAAAYRSEEGRWVRPDSPG